MTIFATPDFGAGAGAALILLIFAAIIVGAVSFAIVYSIRLLWRPSTQEKMKSICLGSFLAITIFGSCYAWWVFDIEPRRQFERLLANDEQVEVVSLTITGQGQRIEISDAASMNYLTLALRSALKEGFVPTRFGTTYSADLRFGHAGSVSVGFYVPDNADGITVSCLMDNPMDSTYYPAANDTHTNHAFSCVSVVELNRA